MDSYFVWIASCIWAFGVSIFFHYVQEGSGPILEWLHCTEVGRRSSKRELKASGNQKSRSGRVSNLSHVILRQKSDCSLQSRLLCTMYHNAFEKTTWQPDKLPLLPPPDDFLGALTLRKSRIIRKRLHLGIQHEVFRGPDICGLFV